MMWRDARVRGAPARWAELATAPTQAMVIRKVEGMNVRGREMLRAPRHAVFAAICDPNALLAVIPGCREIEQVGDGEYRGVISLRLPGMVGTYRTVVRLVETDPPRYGRLEGTVEGALGSIRGHATFRLAEAGGGSEVAVDAAAEPGGATQAEADAERHGRTTIDFQGTAVIDGTLARLDSRFVEGLAGSLIRQGLRNLESRLQGDPPPGTARDTRQPTREASA